MKIPRPGQPVLYWPKPGECAFKHSQPFHAVIAHVWSPTCVNLWVLSDQGRTFTRESCSLVQDRDAQEGECQYDPLS